MAGGRNSVSVDPRWDNSPRHLRWDRQYGRRAPERILALPFLESRRAETARYEIFRVSYERGHAIRRRALPDGERSGKHIAGGLVAWWPDHFVRRHDDAWSFRQRPDRKP